MTRQGLVVAVLLTMSMGCGNFSLDCEGEGCAESQNTEQSALCCWCETPPPRCFGELPDDPPPTVTSTDIYAQRGAPCFTRPDTNGGVRWYYCITLHQNGVGGWDGLQVECWTSCTMTHRYRFNASGHLIDDGWVANF